MTRRAKEREQGFVLLAAVLAVAFIAGVILATWMVVTAQRQDSELERDQLAYLAQLKAQLEQWYAVNAASVDAAAAAPDMQAALRQIGVAPRWNLQVRSSERQTRDGVAFRVIALWLPHAGAPDTTTFDPATGTFIPAANTPNAQINGQVIQSKALAASRAGLQRLAQTLENRFKAQYLADPNRNITINHFRAGSCASPLPDELPCLDDYTAVDANLLLTIGADARLARNSWNLAVEVSNLSDAQTAIPPYTFALRTATPWGTQLRASAIQPL
jgi:hypothetical protein